MPKKEQSPAIAVRLTPEERAFLDEKAKEWDLSLSQIVRRSLRYYVDSVEEGRITPGQAFSLLKK